MLNAKVKYLRESNAYLVPHRLFPVSQQFPKVVVPLQYMSRIEEVQKFGVH
jgi:hypothetical protein